MDRAKRSSRVTTSTSPFAKTAISRASWHGVLLGACDVAEALGLREYLLRRVAFQRSLGWGIGAHWPSGCIIPASLSMEE